MEEKPKGRFYFFSLFLIEIEKQIPIISYSSKNKNAETINTSSFVITKCDRITLYHTL